MSNGLIDDDADGSDISCFGRSKNKATAGDDGEAEAEPSKSKHQVKQPLSKDSFLGILSDQIKIEPGKF